MNRPTAKDMWHQTSDREAAAGHCFVVSTAGKYAFSQILVGVFLAGSLTPPSGRHHIISNGLCASAIAWPHMTNLLYSMDIKCIILVINARYLSILYSRAANFAVERAKYFTQYFFASLECARRLAPFIFRDTIFWPRHTLQYWNFRSQYRICQFIERGGGATPVVYILGYIYCIEGSWIVQ